MHVRHTTLVDIRQPSYGDILIPTADTVMVTVIHVHRLHPSSPKRRMRLPTMTIMGTRTITAIHILIGHTLILRPHNPTLTHIQTHTHTYSHSRDTHSHSHSNPRLHTPSPSIEASSLRGHLHNAASHNHSHSQPPSRTNSHSSDHLPADGNHSHSHPNTHTYQTTLNGLTAKYPHSRSTSPSRKRPVNIPPLAITPPEEEDIYPLHNPVLSRVRGSPDQDSVPSPMTSNYQFGHDDRYDKFHSSTKKKCPNLHDHSRAHDSHEGHSHNMQGVFLHVMAVGRRVGFLLD